MASQLFSIILSLQHSLLWEMRNFQYSEIDSLYMSEFYFLLINNHVSSDDDKGNDKNIGSNIKDTVEQASSYLSAIS